MFCLILLVAMRCAFKQCFNRAVYMLLCVACVLVFPMCLCVSYLFGQTILFANGVFWEASFLNVVVVLFIVCV